MRALVAVAAVAAVAPLSAFSDRVRQARGEERHRRDRDKDKPHRVIGDPAHESAKPLLLAL